MRPKNMWRVLPGLTLLWTTWTPVQAQGEKLFAGMTLIPAGSFVMGDSFGEGNADELPLHTVYISAFYMDQGEVTKAQWDTVRSWAITHGYSFDNPGTGKATNHPAVTVSWYDCAKWCNARSEKEGRTPAYYTSAAQTTVYRTGQLNISNNWVRWDTGYRLPTEAEWEKAMRGGAAGHRFPWSDSDTIQHARANYNSTTNQPYDTSPTHGYNPTYAHGGVPYTSPPGSFPANGYGLYDMAGNVLEWCWDWDSDTYYAASPAADPRGPASGSSRVLRGGSWSGDAPYCRNACRGVPNSPLAHGVDLGFRTVLSITPKATGVWPVSFPNRTVWALCWDDEDKQFVFNQSVFSPAQITIDNLKPNRWYWVAFDVETAQGNGNWVIAYAGWFMRVEVGPGRWIGNWTTTLTISPFWVGAPYVWLLFDGTDGHQEVPYWFDSSANAWHWGTWTTAMLGGWVGFQVPLSDQWYAVFIGDATAGVWY